MAKPGTFKKGQSGNPKGAPKRAWTWAGELQKAVEKKNLDGVAIKEAVAESLIDQALQGNVIASKELMNRMDGMPQQDLNLAGKIEQIVISRESKEPND